jgi:hypothetical protein
VICTNVLYANKRRSADQPTTTKAVAVPTTMPKEIADAIKPHFAEFHDFRSGPRTSRYPAGNGMQALHLKKNETQAVDQPDAGMCKLEGYLEQKIKISLCSSLVELQGNFAPK